MKLHKHLQFMLERKRPADGTGWEQTLNYINAMIADAGYYPAIDDDGNLICTTEYTGVLFSCHLDTVHRSEGKLDIHVDDFGIVTATNDMLINGKKKAVRQVLGADDAAGAYIMLRMIEENYPGTYIFHNSEEIGCLGSQAIARNPYSVEGYDLEDDFTHAIAFDRKGTSDFIYNQLGEVMCSGVCSATLIERLNTPFGMSYRREIGLVTDTAMYAELVQECVNLSVGYYDEHTENERLDLGHTELLLDTILSDRELFTGLPVERDNTVSKYEEAACGWGPKNSSPETILSLVKDYPEAIADMLEEQFAYDYYELYSVLCEMDVV